MFTCKKQLTILNENSTIKLTNKTYWGINIMTSKIYFTEQEVMERANELIEEGFEGDTFDLAMEIANNDYYIIGAAEAGKALNEYGVFNAIEKVTQYEEANFGEVDTDTSNPEELATALFLAITSDVINKNFWDQLNNK